MTTTTNDAETTRTWWREDVNRLESVIAKLRERIAEKDQEIGALKEEIRCLKKQQ